MSAGALAAVGSTPALRPERLVEPEIADAARARVDEPEALVRNRTALALAEKRAVGALVDSGMTYLAGALYA